MDITLVSFSSHAPLAPSFQANNSMDFYLRFYIPKRGAEIKGQAADKKSRTKFRELYILINGLGEASAEIFDELAFEFAQRGMPCVLFPLPAHFCRRTDFMCKGNDRFEAQDPRRSLLTTQEIIIELANEPERIIYGFAQIMHDMDAFWKCFKEGSQNPIMHNYLETHFIKRPKLYLLGYSLGGLVSLSLFLKNPTRYAKIFLLESGANLSDINAGILFERRESLVRLFWNEYIAGKLGDIRRLTKASRKVNRVKHFIVFKQDAPEMHKHWNKLKASKLVGKKQDKKAKALEPFVREPGDAERIWDMVVVGINKRFLELEKEIDHCMRAPEKEVFEMIALGHYRSLYQDKLCLLCRRILIFLGGSDVVFKAEAIQSFSPKKTGLAIVQIPKLGHWLRHSYRDEWIIWRGFIIETILNFTKVVEPKQRENKKRKNGTSKKGR